MACSIASSRVLLPLALLLAPAIAHAQVSAADAAAAQQLFDQGRQLMEQGRFAQACPLFAESQRLDPAGGTLLNLAVCHEKEGRLVTALGEFQTALLQAQRDKRRDREQIARERVNAVSMKVPRLLITLAPGADVPGLQVRLDGTELKREALGTATPVDPGVHRIDASAPGRRAGTFVIPIGEATTKPFEVPVLGEDGSGGAIVGGCPPGTEWTGRFCKPLDPRPIPPPPPAPVETNPPSTQQQPAQQTPPPAEEAVTTRQSPWFYVSLSVAIVSAGTSVVTGLMALSAQDSYKSKCVANRSYCPDPTGADDATRARDLAWVSTISLGVAIAAGIVTIALPRERVSEKKAGLSIGPGGASFAGTF